MGIDTLSIAKDLRAVALPQDQAEAIAAAIGRAMAEGAATRADLDHLGTRLDARIDQLESRVDARFDEMDARVDARFSQAASDLRLVEERMTARLEAAKNQLLTWLVGAIFTATGVLIAVLKL
jgi:outer membrane murein-binding lipoprotein Lpp